MEQTEPQSNARNRIKAAALQLFGERGIDGVSVREITRAAGQKNQGALSYYFRRKEDLVRELVVDGARIMDMRRNEALDRLESGSDPISIRQVVDVLVFPATKVSADIGADSDNTDNFNRFLFLLEMSHRTLFMDALNNQWNSGYQRCLDHFRRLMPAISEQSKNRRFIFIGAFLGSILAKREYALNGNRPGIWADDQTLEHLSGSIVAVLMAPET